MLRYKIIYKAVQEVEREFDSADKYISGELNIASSFEVNDVIAREIIYRKRLKVIAIEELKIIKI